MHGTLAQQNCWRWWSCGPNARRTDAIKMRCNSVYNDIVKFSIVFYYALEATGRTATTMATSSSLSSSSAMLAKAIDHHMTPEYRTSHCCHHIKTTQPPPFFFRNDNSDDDDGQNDVFFFALACTFFLEYLRGRI